MRTDGCLVMWPWAMSGRSCADLAGDGFCSELTYEDGILAAIGVQSGQIKRWPMGDNWRHIKPRIASPETTNRVAEILRELAALRLELNAIAIVPRPQLVEPK